MDERGERIPADASEDEPANDDSANDDSADDDGANDDGADDDSADDDGADDDSANDDGADDDGADDDGANDDSADDDSADDDSANDDSAPDTAASDDSANDDSAPDAAGSDDSATDAAASDDSAPDAAGSDDSATDAAASDDSATDAAASDDSANDDSAPDDGTLSGGDTSPGVVRLELEVESGTYCNPPPYCNGTPGHISVFRLDASAVLRSSSAPPCRPTSCETCQQQPCAGAACIPGAVEVTDEGIAWDGAYQEPGVCGAADESCRWTRYAPPGRYLARMCALRGSVVPLDQPDQSGNTATCESDGSTDCVDIEFDFPSDVPVVGRLPEGSASEPGASEPECEQASDCEVQGLECCDGRCVNLGNDPFNCGACGSECSGAESFCAGSCQAPACEQSCGEGEMCCLQMVGPTLIGCVEPVAGTCPVGCPECDCAAPETPIATPDGERPISELRVGDLVYSIEGEAIVVVPIREVNRTRVTDHQVVRVELEGGGSLRISARHPTADGRDFGMLHAQGELDGVTILDARYEPYREPFTYDILPSSSTGVYFAAGVAIGSTLHGL